MKYELTSSAVVSVVLPYSLWILGSFIDNDVAENILKGVFYLLLAYAIVFFSTPVVFFMSMVYLLLRPISVKVIITILVLSVLLLIMGGSK